MRRIAGLLGLLSDYTIGTMIVMANIVMAAQQR